MRWPCRNLVLLSTDSLCTSYYICRYLVCTGVFCTLDIVPQFVTLPGFSRGPQASLLVTRAGCRVEYCTNYGAGRREVQGTRGTRRTRNETWLGRLLGIPQLETLTRMPDGLSMTEFCHFSASAPYVVRSRYVVGHGHGSSLTSLALGHNQHSRWSEWIWEFSILQS